MGGGRCESCASHAGPSDIFLKATRICTRGMCQLEREGEGKAKPGLTVLNISLSVSEGRCQRAMALRK